MSQQQSQVYEHQKTTTFKLSIANVEPAKSEADITVLSDKLNIPDQYLIQVISVAAWLEAHTTYPAEGCTATLSSENMSMEIQEFNVEQGANFFETYEQPDVRPSMRASSFIKFAGSNPGTNSGTHKFTASIKVAVFAPVR